MACLAVAPLERIPAQPVDVAGEGRHLLDEGLQPRFRAILRRPQRGHSLGQRRQTGLGASLRRRQRDKGGTELGWLGGQQQAPQFLQTLWVLTQRPHERLEVDVIGHVRASVPCKAPQPGGSCPPVDGDCPTLGAVTKAKGEVAAALADPPERDTRLLELVASDHGFVGRRRGWPSACACS